MKTTHLQKQLPEAQHQKPMMAANAVVVVDVVAAAVKVAAKAVAVAVAVMIATSRKPKKAMS
jgi:spore coat protein CotF